MADIELVIRISQVDYETIKSNSIIVGGMTIPNVLEAIRNGVQIIDKYKIESGNEE